MRRLDVALVLLPLVLHIDVPNIRPIVSHPAEHKIRRQPRAVFPSEPLVPDPRNVLAHALQSAQDLAQVEPGPEGVEAGSNEAGKSNGGGL